jgi:hypothetical protein
VIPLRNHLLLYFRAPACDPPCQNQSYNHQQSG